MKNKDFVIINKNEIDKKISNLYYNKSIVLPSNYTLREKDILFIRNQLVKIIKSIKPSINFNKS